MTTVDIPLELAVDNEIASIDLRNLILTKSASETSSVTNGMISAIKLIDRRSQELRADQRYRYARAQQSGGYGDPDRRSKNGDPERLLMTCCRSATFDQSTGFISSWK